MYSIQITERVLPEVEKKEFTPKQKLLLRINAIITVLTLIILLPCIVALINYAYLANSYEVNGRELFFDCTDIELKFKAMRCGDFWCLKNFVIGSETRITTCLNEVTYVTQSDDYRSFLQQLPDLMRSWQTHISVTLYANTTDFIPITSAIYYARNCMSDFHDIKKFVTFHILLPFGQLKHAASTEYTSWSSELKCIPRNALLSTSTLEQKQLLIYPMNIAANLACKSANTALLVQSPSNVLLFPGNSNFLYWTILDEFCHNNFNGQKPIRCAQNLDTAKVIYLLTTFESDGRIFMTDITSMNLEMLTAAYHIRYPIYIGHKSVPYFDERFLETDDDYRFLQIYTLYLQKYSYRTLEGRNFLNYKSVAKIPSSPTKQQPTIKSAAVIRRIREYSILFGSVGTE